MQWRVALWISGVFQTSPTLEIETISRLVPIHLHLKKLYRRFLLWESSLLSNHIINNILSSNRSQEQNCHNTSINHLMTKQRLCLKSPLIDVDNKHNEFSPTFSLFNEEFIPENCLIDLFSDYFLSILVLLILSQTSFSLYLHNQWTDSHKLSCTEKP